MKLSELNARFLRVRRENVDPTKWIDGMLSPSGVREYLDRVEFAEAHGIWFDCPCATCQAPGAHAMGVVIGLENRGCPSGSLSRGKEGGDTRWTIVGGSGLSDLQLRPSIQVSGGCNWHGFVGSEGRPPGEAW